MVIDPAEILSLRGTIVFLALFVIYLCFSVVYNRGMRRQFTDTFWFALGIGLHWVGTLQSQFKLLGIIPEIFYYSGLLFVIVAGIIHIRALTLRYNRTLWRAAAFSAITFGILIYSHSVV